MSNGPISKPSKRQRKINNRRVRPSCQKRADLKSALKSVYEDTVNLKTTCCHSCSCCKVAMPQINYSEFINIVTRVWSESNNERKISLICTAAEYFFRNEYSKWGMDALVKPCAFLSEDKRCTIYEDRPLSCFVPETWIFTDKGPKRIKDVLSGDQVFGSDGKIHKVISTRSKVHNGDILNIKSQGNAFDNWCTPDHLWKVVLQKDKRKIPSAQWVEAEKIISKKCKKTGHYVALPQEWGKKENIGDIKVDLLDYIDGVCEGEYVYPFTSGSIFHDRNYQRVPREIIVDSEFLFMLGIYLAEGGSSETSVSFTMHVKEKHYLDKIDNYLKEKWGINSHYNKIKKGKNVIVLRIDSCLFARFMKKIGGYLAHNKKIHDNLFQVLDNNQLMFIFDAWNVGDGRKSSSEKEYSVTTNSEVLACQMQMILLMNGIYPQVYKNSKGMRRKFYDVHVFPSNFRDCKDGQGTKRMYHEGRIYSPVHEIERKSYVGPVIDIEVEGAESFITPSGIVHNCRLYGQWPEDIYKERVAKFVAAYSKFGLGEKDIPLSKQCPLVKRVDSSVPLTKEVIDGLYAKLDKIDKNIGDFSDLQIKHRENYRTFYDWLLLKVFGEDWLTMLTSFILAATKDQMVDQIEQIKAVIKDKFGKNMIDIREKI